MGGALVSGILQMVVREPEYRLNCPGTALRSVPGSLAAPFTEQPVDKMFTICA